MANVTKISVAAAIARLNAFSVLLNGGTINIYTGTPPANVAASPTGTLLATLTLSATAFATAVAGGPGATATANAITSGTAGNTGIAGWFRAFSSGADGVIQDRIGQSNAGLIMQNTSIVSGNPVSASAWVLSESTG